MSQLARALTDSGIDSFRSYLGRLRKGELAPPPLELLEAPEATREIAVEVELERRRFAHRLEFAKYLAGKFEALAPEDADADAGLWSWLSLYFFDQVCPAAPDGTRRPGADYRHVLDFEVFSRYRHLVYGPYSVYRRHKVLAFPLLSGPLHLQNSIYQEIAGRQDLVAHEGVLQAVMLLYFDPPKLAPKRGAQASGATPGTIRRFVRVLQQLDMTYDIYGLSGRDIVDLLPPEFDAWR